MLEAHEDPLRVCHTWLVARVNAPIGTRVRVKMGPGLQVDTPDVAAPDVHTYEHNVMVSSSTGAS